MITDKFIKRAMILVLTMLALNFCANAQLNNHVGLGLSYQNVAYPSSGSSALNPGLHGHFTVFGPLADWRAVMGMETHRSNELTTLGWQGPYRSNLVDPQRWFHLELSTAPVLYKVQSDTINLRINFLALVFFNSSLKSNQSTNHGGIGTGFRMTYEMRGVALTADVGARAGNDIFRLYKTRSAKGTFSPFINFGIIFTNKKVSTNERRDLRYTSIPGRRGH